MNISLRHRLLVLLTSTTLIAWVGVSVVSVSRTRAEVEELFDAKLAQSAWVLLTLTGHELRARPSLGTPLLLMVRYRDGTPARS